MLGHVRANLWLLGLTVGICCVGYPLLLLGAGLIFRDQAEGSLLYDQDGKVIGSRLIAQPFTDDSPENFQPRPSSVSYNAAASGPSNLGASNFLLRDRVARQLGPIVTYMKEKGGQRVGPEVQDWFAADNNRLGQWAQKYPQLAAAWVNQDSAAKDFVKEWSEKHQQEAEYVAWRKENPDKESPEPGDLAVPFFKSWARLRDEHKPNNWLTLDDKDPDGKPLLDKDKKPSKRVKLVEVTKVEKDEDENTEVQGYFFDFWLQNHADRAADLKPVPADMVMSSGSGLDPHITLDNAHWQLEHRVAEAWAKKLVRNAADPAVKKYMDTVQEKDEAKRKEIEDGKRKEIEKQKREEIDGKLRQSLQDVVNARLEDVLKDLKEAPLGGLVGVDLVNVLELNREAARRMEELARSF